MSTRVRGKIRVSGGGKDLVARRMAPRSRAAVRGEMSAGIRGGYLQARFLQEFAGLCGGREGCCATRAPESMAYARLGHGGEHTGWRG